jgi:hypothetical protein
LDKIREMKMLHANGVSGSLSIAGSGSASNNSSSIPTVTVNGITNGSNHINGNSTTING